MRLDQVEDDLGIRCLCDDPSDTLEHRSDGGSAFGIVLDPEHVARSVEHRVGGSRRSLRIAAAGGRTGFDTSPRLG